MALAILLPMAAPGNTAVEALDLRYGVFWGGIQIAEMALGHVRTPARHRSDLAIETIGLLEQLVQYRARTRARGIAENGTLMPLEFENDYATRKKRRKTVVGFDPDSGDVVHLESTKRGRPTPSKVPPELQRQVVDPLTGFFQLRAELTSGRLDAAPFTAAIFDGRRRYHLVARLVRREQVEIAGSRWDAIRVALSLELLAGSRPGRQDDDDPDLHEHVELLVSDDGRAVPLRLETTDRLIVGRIELLEVCERAGCAPVSG